MPMHSDEVREIQAAEFEQEVRRSDQPVILDFYSTECPPSEAMAPKFDGLAELYGKEVKFLKIFRQGNRELAEQLAVRSSPTLLFWRGGMEIDARLSGGIRRSAIVTALNMTIAVSGCANLSKNVAGCHD